MIYHTQTTRSNNQVKILNYHQVIRPGRTWCGVATACLLLWKVTTSRFFCGVSISGSTVDSALRRSRERTACSAIASSYEICSVSLAPSRARLASWASTISDFRLGVGGFTAVRGRRGWTASRDRRAMSDLSVRSTSPVMASHADIVRAAATSSRMRDDIFTDSPCTIPLLHSITIRYDTRCYFNVRSKANMSQLNLPHGTDN